MLTSLQVKNFRQTIKKFYFKNHRNFPWRETLDPYHILVSEIMLQQTQTFRVLPKYKNFLTIFPTLNHLADAALSDVLSIWSGLGYNRRARFLHEDAKMFINNYHNTIPKDPSELEKLPGIGKATSRSIIVFSYNIPLPFIETNIRRVFIHFFFSNQEKISDSEIMPLVTQTMDNKNPREWFYALMDYGAMLSLQGKNANKRSLHYKVQSKFKGSVRKVRGEIVRYLIEYKELSTESLINKTSGSNEQFAQAFEGLIKDKIISQENKIIRINKN